MATEILINDGGAPARILPFTAGSSISAGDYCVIGSDGEIDKIGTDTVLDGHEGLGVSLIASTSGNIGSVITGHGVVLNTLVSGTAGDLAGVVAIGDSLATSANGFLMKAYTTHLSGSVVAIALEAQTGGEGLAKVLTL